MLRFSSARFWRPTDHKIRQCIQRTALFPGSSDGGTEGHERSAEALRGGLWELQCGFYPLGNLGAIAAENFSKINFEIAYFCTFAN